MGRVGKWMVKGGQGQHRKCWEESTSRRGAGDDVSEAQAAQL
jgi:hypothetical protein